MTKQEQAPKIYLAQPLFNEMERRRNQEGCDVVESYGYRTFLPQRDEGVQSDFHNEDEEKDMFGKVADRFFHGDLRHLEESNILFAYVDGRVPDDGMSFEMGYAYKMGLPIVIIMTDSRSFEYGKLNNMLDQSALFYAKDEHEAIAGLKERGIL